MTAWIGETFTSSVGRDHLEALVDVGNRMAGSPGEREAAELTRDALADVGARNARLEEFDVQGWTRGSSELRVGNGVQDCIALPGSPSGEASGEFVDLGYGLPSAFEEGDLDGAIVMVSNDVPGWFDRHVHRREKYYRAVEAGAAAFVFRNSNGGGLARTGSVGRSDRPIGDVPAVGVSNETGARLARRFADDEVAVDVDVDVHEATSRNVHAELGPRTDEQVLVTCHVDAHDLAEGAVDNGSGTATVVEIANALATREDELDTRVHCVAFGAEEVGLVGSRRLARRVDHGTVKAVVNLDVVAHGRGLRLSTHGFDGLDEAAGAVSERLDHPLPAIPKHAPHSDHWPFVRWGTPGCLVMSEHDSSKGSGVHTATDTFDKVNFRNLREQAILLTEFVVELASGQRRVESRSPEEIAAELEAENRAAGMKATGEWPYDDGSTDRQ